FFFISVTMLQGQNVGIGTNSPNPLFKLDVIGNIGSSGYLYSNGLQLTGPGNFSIMFDGNNSNNFYRWMVSGGRSRYSYHYLPTNYIRNIMVIDSVGRVGIGPNNPTTFFDVSNSFGGLAARFNGGNNMAIEMSENNDTRGYLGSTIGAQAEDVDLTTASGNTNGKLHLGTLQNPRLTINALGNIGIGTQNPSAPFHLDRPSTSNLAVFNGGNQMFLTFAENGLNRGYIGSFSGAEEDVELGTYSSNTTGKVHLTTNNTPRLSVRNDGNVGIGVTNAISKLHVVDIVDASYSTHGYFQLGNTNSSNLVFDNNEILAREAGLESDLFIQNDGGNLLLCGDENGAVGIGITNGANLPFGSLLAVDGKITCEEVLVKLSQNWPDYVFAPNYNLRPLDEVKLYIQKNEHLPGIPSATEMQENGQELGSMQVIMMEKIEELTLYIIQLQEEINKLKEK
ncbi:MAG TPA: hypothetical protein PLZ32_19505, partial [Saprospiraceae bacterium]|nr:hypothetical protein [Saprospiraceae bacterium]